MSPSLALACPQGYCYTERARPRSTQSMNSLGTNHGGIVVFHQTSYRVGRIDLPNLVSMEALGLRITSGSSTIVLIAIYRTGTINDLFFEEFERVIEVAVATNCRVIVVGDFNIHMDVIDDTSAVRFRRVLVPCGLQQHVNVATHNAGHTLDLVISDDVCDELDSLELHDPGLSDHQCISFNIALSSVGSTRDRVHIRRNWSTFDRAAFESDLAASELALSSSTDVEWLYGEYDNCISKLLDKHAPAQTRVIKDRPLAPWFDLECVLEKRGLRRLESTLRRTESPICYRE